MKVGILTYHRAHNYGAVLQCYALQEVLKSMGHDVWVIDYKQEFIDRLYCPKFNIKHLIKLLLLFRVARILKFFSIYHEQKRRKHFFDDFKRNYLHCTEEFSAETIGQDFDAYVIGSDQVWGLHCTNGFDPVYWGQFTRSANSRLFGYAISANGDYKGIISRDCLVRYFNSFEDISFRESSTRDDFAEYTGIVKEVSLDPTLLTDKCIWQPLLNKKKNVKKYVVVYQIRRLPHYRSMLEDKASSFAKNKGYELIDLTNMEFPVPEFVSLIANAECVFTSSFHATVFSIIFGKPFYSFKLYDGHDNRYENLLKVLGLTAHLADEFSAIDDAMPISQIDVVREKLVELRKSSLEYLERSLS